MTDLRGEIADLIQRMVGRTDARLLAYAVMPTHLHVLLRQGRLELASVMQPLMRRVAHLAQRRHGFSGGVVERRYRDRLCETADHVREALIYVHLNPWRAGICGEELVYPWTSHAAYLPGADPRRHSIDPDIQRQVLELFAGAGGSSRDSLCRGYEEWLAWRMERLRVDAASAPESHPADLLRHGRSRAGAATTRTPYLVPFRYDVDGGRPLLPDLRDYFAAQLPAVAPGRRIEELRGRRVPRRLSRHRTELIRAAVARGYRTGDVARFFGISATTVSAAKYTQPAGVPEERL